MCFVGIFKELLLLKYAKVNDQVALFEPNGQPLEVCAGNKSNNYRVVLGLAVAVGEEVAVGRGVLVDVGVAVEVGVKVGVREGVGVTVGVLVGGLPRTRK